MKLQSVSSHVLDIPDGEGRRQIQPGEVFEVDDDSPAALKLRGRYDQVIEIVDESQPGPTKRIVYVGLASSRWIPALQRALERDKPSEVPLWLARFVLDTEPGNFQEA